MGELPIVLATLVGIGVSADAQADWATSEGGRMRARYVGEIDRIGAA